MRRLVPIAVLLLLAASSSFAQRAPDTSEAPVPSSQQTPLQAAEMRAEILMARKDYAQAVRAYEDLVRQDPKNATFLNQEGIAYQQLSNLDLAERYYKRAVKADPKFADAINNLGTLEYANQRYGKAIKYYKKALVVGGNSATVYSNLGYAYYAERQYAHATEAFDKALAADPDIFARKGGGGSIVQQLSTSEPGMLHFLVAKSYAKAGDAERAARYLKMARDDGYKDFMSAKKDADFARVINDPRVQEVLRARPPYAAQPSKPVSN